MKADAPHVVPLTAQVLEILKTLPRFERGDHLFSTSFGMTPVNGFSQGKGNPRSQAQADYPQAGRAVRDPRYSPHDAHRAIGAANPRSRARAGHRPHEAWTAQGLRSVRVPRREARALDRWAGRLRDIVDAARPTSLPCSDDIEENRRAPYDVFHQIAVLAASSCDMSRRTYKAKLSAGFIRQVCQNAEECGGHLTHNKAMHGSLMQALDLLRPYLPKEIKTDVSSDTIWRATPARGKNCKK